MSHWRDNPYEVQWWEPPVAFIGVILAGFFIWWTLAT